MDSLGFVSTSVAGKSLMDVSILSTSTSPTSDSGLLSSVQFTNSPFLRFWKSTSIPSLQCPSRRRMAVQSVLLERGFHASDQEALHSHHACTLKSSSSPVRREMTPLHQLRQGGFPEDDSQIYRQIFVIRSYEVGSDKSISIREVFSFFQEMALNHVQLLQIAGDGFGATRAMNRRGLIWVVTKMQVHVERYPSWPEVIEIDSWVAQAGRNGMRRDWIMRSYRTGEVLARATSTWCMMNGSTRRLSKIPEEVRDEIEPAFVSNRSVFKDNECAAERIAKLDEGSTQHQRAELTSTQADLDMNQHVNNLKYINWVLESIPVAHLETHKLASIVLEYRRECHSSDIVESLASSKRSISGEDSDFDGKEVELPPDGLSSCCQFTHLLRTQGAGQQEILRGKTTWRVRSGDNNVAC